MDGCTAERQRRRNGDRPAADLSKNLQLLFTSAAEKEIFGNQTNKDHLSEVLWTVDNKQKRTPSPCHPACFWLPSHIESESVYIMLAGGSGEEKTPEKAFVIKIIQIT